MGGRPQLQDGRIFLGIPSLLKFRGGGGDRLVGLVGVAG